MNDHPTTDKELESIREFEYNNCLLPLAQLGVKYLNLPHDQTVELMEKYVLYPEFVN